MGTIMAAIGAATVTVLAAVYLVVAVKFYRMFRREYPDWDKWYSDLFGAILWPIVAAFMLYHLDRESRGKGVCPCGA